ncbi:MAG TPA: PepSY-like domain-containing protein [Saprospiraceae bacterium]|nr:PepSY-like domain-containing protein [Saprospiraceae bacterium]
MKIQWIFLIPLAAMLFVASKCDDDDGSTIELPAVIQNYLNSNYSGYKIEESELDSLCTGTAVYDVELEGPKDKEVQLTFDTEGNLLFTEAEIKTNDLPTAIAAGINAKYAGAVVEEAARLDLTGGGTQYEVELKQGQTHLEVLFAADGTVICAETGDDDDE